MDSGSPRPWGNVFDRLHDPTTYTGVYAERFRSGPRINHNSDVSTLSPRRSTATGFTNAGTGEVVRDLRHITRDYLNRDVTSPTSPTARAAAKNAARMAQSERAFFGSLATGGDESAAALEDGAAGGGGDDLVDVPLDTNTQLQLIFQYYCRFGRTAGTGEETDTIDSFNFSKFTRECPGMLDKVLNPTEVDLIFVKCKAKTARRLTYGQFLDALSAMASVKYHDVDDAAAAFSLLLAEHVFQCPASLGIAAALRSGMLKLEPTPAITSGRPSAASPVAPMPRGSAPGRASAGPSSMAPAAPPPPTAPVAPGGTTAAATPAAAAAPPFAWPFPFPPPHMPPGADASAPGSYPFPFPYPFPPYAGFPAQPAPGTLVAAGEGGGAAHPFYWPYAMPPPPPPPPPSSAPSGLEGGGMVSRKEEGGGGKAPTTTAAGMGAGEAPSHPPYYWPAYPWPGTAPAPPPAVAARGVDYTPVGGGGGGGRTMERTSSATTREVRTANVLSLLAPVSTSTDLVGGPLTRTRSPRASRSPSRLGSPDFKPTVAGEANMPGGVYDRLSSPKSFTGVYRRAWLTDGRMNHFADTGVSRIPTKYVGDTNTGSDETIHDISVLLRPNLQNGKGFR